MASALLTRVRSLERAWSETALPAGTCPACAGAVLVLIDPEATAEEQDAKMRCKACGSDVSDRAKVLIVPEDCI